MSSPPSFDTFIAVRRAIEEGASREAALQRAGVSETQLRLRALASAAGVKLA